MRSNLFLIILSSITFYACDDLPYISSNSCDFSEKEEFATSRVQFENVTKNVMKSDSLTLNIESIALESVGERRPSIPQSAITNLASEFKNRGVNFFSEKELKLNELDIKIPTAKAECDDTNNSDYSMMYSDHFLVITLNSLKPTLIFNGESFTENVASDYVDRKSVLKYKIEELTDIQAGKYDIKINYSFDDAIGNKDGNSIVCTAETNPKCLNNLQVGIRWATTIEKVN